jgi:predicted lipoprotein
MARDIASGWQDGAPYTKAYLEPGPANSAYHNEKEVTLELFKTFTTGIETVRDQKMAKALGAKPEQARPQLAPFWRSGLSFANMADNLVSVRELFAKGGFAQVVHDESAGVENSIVFDLNHAFQVLRGIDKPITQAVHDEDIRAKLEALRVSLKSAATTAGDTISRGAGLTFGFNAMDGD